MPYVSPDVIVFGSDGSGGVQEKGTAYPFVVDGYGTAGSPAGGVVSVQGVSNGTPQPISGTVSSKTQDGYGIRISSTLTGSKRGLSVSLDGYSVSTFPTHVTNPLTVSNKVSTSLDGYSVSFVPVRVTGTVPATQSGNWNERLQDGYGNIVTSTIAGAKRGIDENLSSWLGSTAPTVGSKTSINSVPVVIASDQSTVSTKIDGYSVAFVPVKVVSGSITASNNVRDGYGNIVTSTIAGAKRGLDENLSSWIGSQAPTVGSKASISSIPVVIASDQATVSTKLDGYSVAFLPVKVTSGTVSANQSGNWNERLQDGYGNIVTSTIAGAKRGVDENLSSWLGSQAPTVGSKASVSSIPVVIASDQANLPTKTLDGYGNIITSTITGAKRSLDVTATQTTAANLNAAVVGIGSAGAPTGGILSIQGVSGGQAVPISGSVTATNPSVGSDNTAKPSSDTLIGGSDGTNLQATRVFDGDTGVGTEWDLGVIVRLPASGGSVAGGTSSNPFRTDPTGTTTQPVSQGTAAALSGGWPVKVTDGTNTMPTMDVIARRGFVTVTDGTNSMPTGDVAARGIYERITDGTNTAAVKAASTAAATTDPALVVAISPNNSPIVVGNKTNNNVAPGSNNLGVLPAVANASAPSFTEGNQVSLSTSLAGVLRVRPTDGTNSMPTMDAVARAGYMQQTDGTNIMPTGDVAARGIYERITDGTNTAAVKGASTAAATTDPALVVAISPNNSPTIVGNKTNNSATPGATNIGALTALANAANPSFTEGNLVTLSSLLNGAIRTDNTSWLGSTAPTVGQKIMANSIPVTMASDQSVPISGVGSGSWIPATPSTFFGTTRGQKMPLQLGADGSLQCYSEVLTDAGSFREDFPGTSLQSNLTGTITFTNGSTSVTGSGCTFTTQINRFSFIKLTGHADTVLNSVLIVIDDNTLTLSTPYGGATGSGVGINSFWFPTIGSGGGISVANSQVSITSGTTSGANTWIRRGSDYGPMKKTLRFNVSQRIANQTVRMGFFDNFTNPTQQACIELTGTDNTQVSLVCRSSSAATDVETVTATLPRGFTTASLLNLIIAVMQDRVVLYFDPTDGGPPIFIAMCKNHIPTPYVFLTSGHGFLNTGVPGSTTTLNLDLIYLSNYNQLEVALDETETPQSYGVSNQALTITLASLTTGSARASTAVDNTILLFDDILFFVKATLAASGVSATGYINIYGYATVDDGTTYPEAITGTDAGVTLSAPPNLVLLAQVTANANNKVCLAGPFSFCKMYGLPRLPTRWGLVFVNQSGATLIAGAGNHGITWQGIEYRGS